MKQITLKPVDSFFFRGHAYADAGSDTTMIGLFPPRPNTIYNALRSAYIHQHSSFDRFYREEDADIKRWMGSPHSIGDFSIKATFIYKDDRLVLPLPLDYQVIEEEGHLHGYPLRLMKNDYFQSSNSTSWGLYAEKQGKKSKHAQGTFAKMDEWKQTVLNQTPIQSLMTTSDFIDGYAKVGNHVDPLKRQAKKHFLYRMNMLTMKSNCVLSVLTNRSPDFANVAFARLGAENRPWTIKQTSFEQPFFWKDEELAQIEKQIHATGIARVILLTSAIWKQGSRPSNFEEDSGTLILPNHIEVKPLAWAVGRPELFGGWDIVRNRPKQRQWMVPAGTVIYIRVEKEKISTLMDLANGFHFTDESAQEGFGFSIISGLIKGG